MILRTFHFIGPGLDIGLDRVVIFLLLVWGLTSNLVVCSCVSPHCSITSEASEILRPWLTEASTRHRLKPRSTLLLSEVKHDNTHSRPRSINVSSVNTSLKHSEGEAKSDSRPRPSVIPTGVLPQIGPGLNVDSQIQVVPKAINASVNHIQTEDYAKSLYKLNTAALLRGFYVFGGLGAMVVMYILVRTIRLRRSKSTVLRYGILTNREDVEMTPLGATDDEETTIFEVNSRSRT